MIVMSDPQEAYDRGHTAGQISARLDDYGLHLSKINGSMESVSQQLKALSLAVQSLADQRQSDNDTVIATAKALKEAEEARRAKSDQSWTPMARLISVVSVIIAVAGIILAVYANAGRG